MTNINTYLKVHSFGRSRECFNREPVKRNHSIGSCIFIFLFYIRRLRKSFFNLMKLLKWHKEKGDREKNTIVKTYNRAAPDQYFILNTKILIENARSLFIHSKQRQSVFNWNLSFFLRVAYHISFLLISNAFISLSFSAFLSFDSFISFLFSLIFSLFWNGQTKDIGRAMAAHSWTSSTALLLFDFASFFSRSILI